MKKFIAGIAILSIVGVFSFYGAKKIAFDSFQFGLSKASESYRTCVKNDDSKEVFPQYFQACKSLCNTLYKEKPICVSSIDGGSVTCVCEQHEKENK